MSADAAQHLAADAMLVARFIVGYWPGLEDGIAWGADVDASPVLLAAKRIAEGVTGDGERPAREPAWLVERGHSENQVPTLWWTGAPPHELEVWTADANKARRFPTKEAADTAIADVFTHPSRGPSCHATEHVWLSRDDIPGVMCSYYGTFGDPENCVVCADRPPESTEAMALEWLARLIEEIGWGADATEGETYYRTACDLLGHPARTLAIAEPSNEPKNVERVRAAFGARRAAEEKP